MVANWSDKSILCLRKSLIFFLALKNALLIVFLKEVSLLFIPQFGAIIYVIFDSGTM